MTKKPITNLETTSTPTIDHNGSSSQKNLSTAENISKTVLEKINEDSKAEILAIFRELFETGLAMTNVISKVDDAIKNIEEIERSTSYNAQEEKKSLIGIVAKSLHNNFENTPPTNKEDLRENSSLYNKENLLKKTITIIEKLEKNYGHDMKKLKEEMVETIIELIFDKLENNDDAELVLESTIEKVEKLEKEYNYDATETKQDMIFDTLKWFYVNKMGGELPHLKSETKYPAYKVIEQWPIIRKFDQKYMKTGLFTKKIEDLLLKMEERFFELR